MTEVRGELARDLHVGQPVLTPRGPGTIVGFEAVEHGSPPRRFGRVVVQLECALVAFQPSELRVPAAS